MDQVQVDRNTFTRLVAGAAKAGSMLIYNSDATNTVNLTDTDAGNPATASSVPLGPTQSVVVDGNTDVYAFATVGTPVVYLIPGATSFFQRPNLAAIGGASVFVQATVPGGTIPPNSIWFDTANASLQTWNGTMWVQQQFDANQLIQAATILGTQIANNAVTAAKVANGTLTSAQLAAAAGILGTQIANATITSGNIAANTIVAGNIAANTITAAQLAAGIVYAGIVDATTITGANIVAQGSAGEILVYSGTAAAGNLVASISATAGTDSHGNAFLAGIVSYQQGSPSTAIRLNVSGSTMSLLQATSFAGPWSIIGSLTCTLAAGMSLSATGGLTMNGPTLVTSGDLTTDTGRNVVVGGVITSTAGTRGTPTVISTDSWTTFGAFGTGFGAGGIAPQQSLTPTGPGGKGCVKLRGQILSTAATAANATMVTAVGGPTQNMSWIVPTNAAGYAPAAGSLPRVVTVDTAGNVRLQPSTSAANQFVLLDGIEFPLA